MNSEDVNKVIDNLSDKFADLINAGEPIAKTLIQPVISYIKVDAIAGLVFGLFIMIVSLVVIILDYLGKHGNSAIAWFMFFFGSFLAMVHVSRVIEPMGYILRQALK